MKNPEKNWPRSNEPIFWGMFSVGGMAIAFFFPALILITGLLAPFGGVGDLLSYSNMTMIAQNFFGKLVIWGVISVSMWHVCHRLYHGMHDLRLDMARGFFKVFWYGIAAVITVVCAAYLWII